MAFKDDIAQIVHDVLSDPLNLPAQFLDYIPQFVAQNPVPLARSSKITVIPFPTTKQVVSTVAKTDLLNGAGTVPGTLMGTTGLARLTAWGDSIQNSGSGQAAPRFELKLGTSTLFDTGAPNGAWGTNTGRWGWRFIAEIFNQAATNSQWANLHGTFTGAMIATAPGFTVGEGIYSIVTNLAVLEGGNSAAVNTAATQTLAFSVTLPVSSANCDVTFKGATLEIISS